MARTSGSAYPSEPGWHAHGKTFDSCSAERVISGVIHAIQAHIWRDAGCGAAYWNRCV